MATVTIQKRERESGVIKYAVSYYDKFTGKKKYHKTFSRLGDARECAEELKRSLESGKPVAADKKNEKMTFAQVSEILRAEWNESLSNGNISQKTHQEYMIRINVLNREFGKIPLASISEANIKAYRDKIAKATSKLNANRSTYILKRIMRKGLEIKAILHDPTMKIGKLSEKEHIRNRYLKPIEVETLIKAAGEDRGKKYLPALICLGAEHGASKQECLSLKWSDIDFDYQGIGIIRFFRTKNKKERTEMLMPRSREQLIALKKRHKSNLVKYKQEEDLDLVFSHVDGTDMKRFDKAFHRACKKAGIENFHFHDLRHTFCSNLILAGAGLKDVKEMIGHADIAMTDRYSHLPAEHKQLMQQRLANHYQKAI